MKQQRIKLNNWQRVRHALKICLLPLLIAAATFGCRLESNVATGINPVGTYTLVSVDGQQVPCEVKHDGHTLTIRSGAFAISADGHCSSKMIFTPPSGSEVTKEVKATYTREGSRLTMSWEGAGTTVGSVAGDTFTMNNEGMVLAYRR